MAGFVGPIIGRRQIYEPGIINVTAPSNVTLTNGVATSVGEIPVQGTLQIQWDTVPGTDYYEIAVMEAGQDPDDVVHLSIDAGAVHGASWDNAEFNDAMFDQETGLTLTGLKPHKVYEVAVRAVVEGQKSGWVISDSINTGTSGTPVVSDIIVTSKYEFLEITWSGVNNYLTKVRTYSGPSDNYTLLSTYTLKGDSLVIKLPLGTSITKISITPYNVDNEEGATEDHLYSAGYTRTSIVHYDDDQSFKPWTFTGSFLSSDYRTITISAGTLHIIGKDSIEMGEHTLQAPDPNTFYNILYETNNSVFSLETVSATSLNSNKILIGSMRQNSDTEKLAIFFIRGGSHQSPSIETGHLMANAVTANEIDVNDLFAQNITMNTGGKINAGGTTIDEYGIYQDDSISDGIIDENLDLVSYINFENSFRTSQGIPPSVITGVSHRNIGGRLGRKSMALENQTNNYLNLSSMTDLTKFNEWFADDSANGCFSSAETYEDEQWGNVFKGTTVFEGSAVINALDSNDIYWGSDSYWSSGDDFTFSCYIRVSIPGNYSIGFNWSQTDLQSSTINIVNISNFFDLTKQWQRIYITGTVASEPLTEVDDLYSEQISINFNSDPVVQYELTMPQVEMSAEDSSFYSKTDDRALPSLKYPFAGNNTGTFLMWIKQLHLMSTETILFGIGNESSSELLTLRKDSSNRIVINTGSAVATSINPVLDDSEYHLLGFTYDENAGTTQLLIDGELDNSGNISGAHFGIESTKMRFHADVVTNSNVPKIAISEFLYLPYTVSLNQFKALNRLKRAVVDANNILESLRISGSKSSGITVGDFDSDNINITRNGINYITKSGNAFPFLSGFASGQIPFKDAAGLVSGGCHINVINGETYDCDINYTDIDESYAAYRAIVNIGPLGFNKIPMTFIVPNKTKMSDSTYDSGSDETYHKNVVFTIEASSPTQLIVTYKLVETTITYSWEYTVAEIYDSWGGAEKNLTAAFGSTAQYTFDAQNNNVEDRKFKFRFQKKGYEDDVYE